MNKDTRRLWEVRGQTNALYIQWCAARNVNYYRQLVLYALEAHAPTTQKKIQYGALQANRGRGHAGTEG